MIAAIWRTYQQYVGPAGQDDACHICRTQLLHQGFLFKPILSYALAMHSRLQLVVVLECTPVLVGCCNTQPCITVHCYQPSFAAAGLHTCAAAASTARLDPAANVLPCCQGAGSVWVPLCSKRSEITQVPVGTLHDSLSNSLFLDLLCQRQLRLACTCLLHHACVV
jgi:hypothetical protein